MTRSESLSPDPRLIVVSRSPFNAETPLGEQLGLLTPTPLFYVRNHFPVPRLAAADYRLRVEGAVERPLTLTYADLRALPSRSLLATLECAGNGRSYLRPPAEGEQWQYGAVSTGEWTGAPLGAVLALAGLQAQACEVLIAGADAGHVPAAGGETAFERSLPLEKALDPETLLAYALNGEPLPLEHGFPVRLVVPGWYGMASVKWVTRIAALTAPFRGFYQADRYVMAHPERSDPGSTPLTTMRVRSLITSPADGSALPSGEHRVRGLAWSGAGPVVRVEVSADAGATWQEAELVSPPERYAWRRWEFRWWADQPGQVTLRSRAFDAAGQGQPAEPEWNRLGYANNAVQAVTVEIR